MRMQIKRATKVAPMNFTILSQTAMFSFSNQLLNKLKNPKKVKIWHDREARKIWLKKSVAQDAFSIYKNGFMCCAKLYHDMDIPCGSRVQAHWDTKENCAVINY